MKYDTTNLKLIEGLDNIYYADEFGNIYNRRGKKLKPCYTGKQSSLSNSRYQHVTLPKNGKIRTILIHRLIAETFIPNPNNYSQINHKNGIKSDNRVENLEWCSASQNQRHRFDYLKDDAKGEKNGRHKLTENEVTEIYNLMKNSEGKDYIKIAEKFNISQGTPFDIYKGRSWTHITGLPNIRKN